MNNETDAVESFRMVLKQLASDPRTLMIPNVRVALQLFDVAVGELAQRQADMLQTMAAIASELADAALRLNGSKDLHNMECLRALADGDLRGFGEAFRVLHE